MTPIEWERFRTDLLEWYRVNRSRETLRRIRQMCDEVGALGVRSTADLTRDLVTRYTASLQGRERPLRNITVNGRLSCLRAACEWAMDGEPPALNRNPVVGGRRRAVFLRAQPAAMVRHHGREQIAAVFALLESEAADWRSWRLFAVFATIALTGLRRSEALYLQAPDVDLGSGWIQVGLHRRTKTEAAAAAVPAPPRLIAILREWRRLRPHVPRPVVRLTANATTPLGVLRRAGQLVGRDQADRYGWIAAGLTADVLSPPWLFPGSEGTAPWHGENGRRPLDYLRAAGERAGVPGLTWLSLRHSFATAARRYWGFGRAQLKAQLRHTSLRTQGHYVHDDDDEAAAELVAAIQRVSYDDPTPQPAAPVTLRLFKGDFGSHDSDAG